MARILCCADGHAFFRDQRPTDYKRLRVACAFFVILRLLFNTDSLCIDCFSFCSACGYVTLSVLQQPLRQEGSIEQITGLGRTQGLLAQSPHLSRVQSQPMCILHFTP